MAARACVQPAKADSTFPRSALDGRVPSATHPSMRLLTPVRAFVLGLLMLACPAAAQSLGGPDHVKASLAAETQGAAPGATVYVALIQKIEPGWHTYWKNPGDAGLPPTIAWTLPTGWRAGDIVWPAPKRLPVGPLMNYGYEGEVILPVPIEAPADARPGQTAHLAADVQMLVCAATCVPQESKLALDLPVTAGAPPPDPTWGDAIARTLAAAPKDSGLAAT